MWYVLMWEKRESNHICSNLKPILNIDKLSSLEVEYNYESTFKIIILWSFQARDRKVAGDLDGARHYGSTARCLNIWATVLVSITVLITFIVMIVVLVKANEMSRTYSINRFNFNYSW